MKQYAGHPTRQLLAGTLRVFLADMMILPTGLVTTAYLTRRFGPEAYGLFILSAIVVAWVEWSVAALFSRTTIKFVSEAQDWRPVGAAVVWLHLLTSAAAMLLLALLAGPLAALLHEPHLAGYLRLFSLDIPLFSLAQAHRNILVGIGGFRERACGVEQECGEAVRLGGRRGPAYRLSENASGAIVSAASYVRTNHPPSTGCGFKPSSFFTSSAVTKPPYPTVARILSSQIHLNQRFGELYAVRFYPPFRYTLRIASK